MSQNQSQWPQRFKNQTGDVLPAFSIFRVVDGEHNNSGELVLYALLSEGEPGEALYVSSPLEVADEGYGWCRSVSDPPFWVKNAPYYSPTAGDSVGPVSGEAFVDDESTGLVVLYVDSDNELVRCDVVRGTAGNEDEGGYPPGTGDCNCGWCPEGRSIPDASGPSQCCTSHLQWTFYDPWRGGWGVDGEPVLRTLKYEGNNTWLTDPFDGPDCDGFQNEYRWQLTVSVTGRSYLTLLLETDNGCDPVCIVYGRDSFDCQCDNTLSVLKPYGSWMGTPRNWNSCYVCLHPDPAGGFPTPPLLPTTMCDVAINDIPLYVNVTLDGGAYDECGDCNWDYSVLNNSDTICFVHDIGVDGDGQLAFVEYRGYVDLADSDICGGGTPDPSGQVLIKVRYGGCQASVSASTTYPFAGVGTIVDNHFGLTSGFIDPPFAIVTDLWTGYPSPLECDGAPPSFNISYGAVPGTPSYGDVGATAATSDGVCDETCGEPPAPVDPDPGACCLDGTCYDFWDEALCNDFGGTWNPAGCDDCEGDPHTPCCVAGSCVPVDPWACVNVLGGTIAAGDCDDGVCDEGACCSAATGACSITSEADCAFPNYWWGENTDCDPDPCPSIGACCHNPDDVNNNCGTDPDCECAIMPLADCGFGNYAGDGTNCTSPGGVCECHGQCEFF